jgi:hypothetical protein
VTDEYRGDFAVEDASVGLHLVDAFLGLLLHADKLGSLLLELSCVVGKLVVDVSHLLDERVESLDVVLDIFLHLRRWSGHELFASVVDLCEEDVRASRAVSV